MTTPFLSVERYGRVAVLTMSRPESMNAIGTIEDCDNIVETFFALGNDRSVSAIVLTGSGRAFSSGGNIKGMQQRQGIGVLEQPDSTRANYRRGVQRATRAMLDCEIPMIAAINGHAIGLGLDLACLCDVRVAAESAKMAASFIKVGIVPGDGGAWTLQKIVGYSKAAELFLTGRTFDAAYAQSIGLVGTVVPDAELIDAAVALGQEIAANSPRALRLTKKLLREAQHARAHDVLELSAAFQAIAHETQDHKEAVAAILEKRAPVFTGE
ncbi:crotonase/enoyl-CoA hydratase family protein [Novosphingobium sp. KCTC 2891]|uniref:crotonase/enoyl-CoA hydratase family protein n=1 Tax=Novosphingobium sp. KCTC 2891 TaxID=2989730 RepID=UPI002221A3B8|nr:crotonase/enoyl-CoA hydratase family protein [Novosphingobium sp. KCTC 2891]MCW1381208.1 crotonase/enoyl-CoA hydratase family protein [Novosphingobium sp. KCTC 2891]